MDPISVAASVAGLVSLTIEASQIIASYCKAVKDAPKSIDRVHQELISLTSALQQLDEFLHSQRLKDTTFDQSAVLSTALKSCTGDVEVISNKLPKLKQDGTSSRLERLKWPFGEKDLQKTLKALRGYTTTFQFSLTIEGW